MDLISCHFPLNIFHDGQVSILEYLGTFPWFSFAYGFRNFNPWCWNSSSHIIKTLNAFSVFIYFIYKDHVSPLEDINCLQVFQD